MIRHVDIILKINFSKTVPVSKKGNIHGMSQSKLTAVTNNPRNLSGLTKQLEDWQSGSSNKAPTKQVQGPKFKPEYHQKNQNKNKNFIVHVTVHHGPMKGHIKFIRDTIYWHLHPLGPQNLQGIICI
jgi:hypothetical protein